MTNTKTYGVKYIGSKDKLIPHIETAVKSLPTPKTCIDVFTGTTRVAQAFKNMGLKTITSDLSWASECYANTFIANHDNAHLSKIIDKLNNLKPATGWLTKNYCDIITDEGGIVRVWQPKNGMKADAIRDHIETLDLKKWEKSTLITALIFALDAVDNTVGVQQAYLKSWCSRSYKDLELKLPIVPAAPQGKHYTGNALDIDYPEADFAYLDPPYSQHSYATYYHIWDSIARWDKPEVGLKTNRRIDRVSGDDSFDDKMVSAWNKKNEALDATQKLIEKLPVKYIILSYNNEGLIGKDDLFRILTNYKHDIKEIDYKRNIMSSIGNATLHKSEFNIKNKEYIITIEK